MDVCGTQLIERMMKHSYIEPYIMKFVFCIFMEINLAFQQSSIFIDYITRRWSNKPVLP